MGCLPKESHACAKNKSPPWAQPPGEAGGIHSSLAYVQVILICEECCPTASLALSSQSWEWRGRRGAEAGGKIITSTQAIGEQQT